MNKQMNKRINENINYINKLKHKACESVPYILEFEKQNTFIFEYETTRVQIFFQNVRKEENVRIVVNAPKMKQTI